MCRIRVYDNVLFTVTALLEVAQTMYSEGQN
jgi:hypothetical protein